MQNANSAQLRSIMIAVSERCAISTMPSLRKAEQNIHFGERKRNLQKAKMHCSSGAATKAQVQGGGCRARPLRGGWWRSGGGGRATCMEPGAAQWPRDLRQTGRCRSCAFQVDGGDGCHNLHMYLRNWVHQQHQIYTGNPVLDQSCL